MIQNLMIFEVEKPKLMAKISSHASAEKEDARQLMMSNDSWMSIFLTDESLIIVYLCQ